MKKDKLIMALKIFSLFGLLIFILFISVKEVDARHNTPDEMMPSPVVTDFGRLGGGLWGGRGSGYFQPRVSIYDNSFTRQPSFQIRYDRYPRQHLNVESWRGGRQTFNRHIPLQSPMLGGGTTIPFWSPISPVVIQRWQNMWNYNNPYWCC